MIFAEILSLQLLVPEVVTKQAKQRDDRQY